jgi:hypothetical protein
MTWDPTVLRKYNTTGHFRLLNQVRSELKGNPLIRPKDGETVGEANRSRSLTRALEGRVQAGYGRSRRNSTAAEVVVVSEPQRREARNAATGDGFGSSYSFPGAMALANVGPQAQLGSDLDHNDNANNSFRERLNAIDMR